MPRTSVELSNETQSIQITPNRINQIASTNCQILLNFTGHSFLVG